MYYKIVADGIIVDACEDIRFVKWQEKNRVWLNCGENNADGIVTSDGESIYLIGEKEIDGYGHAAYSEITEEESAEIRAEIDAGREIPDEGGEEEEEEDTPPKTRLAALEETVSLLTECILEMSGIVYGGDAG